MSYQPSLKLEYQKKIIPLLKKELKLRNDYAVPRLEKIVINVGLGRASENHALLDEAKETLFRITGQKPVITLAHQSISGFKIRTGSKVGLKVTLRGKRMYDFLQRLVQVALPRVRDFRGLSVKSFDGKGNYTLGIRECVSFPEINLEEIKEIFGLEVIIVSTAKNNREGEMLLRAFGFPFKEK